MNNLPRLYFSSDREGGFTLLEMLIALAILMFGLLGVSGLFIYSIDGNSMGKHMTEATSLAQSKLDKLTTSTPYLSLDLEHDNTESGIDATGSSTGTSPKPYTRKTTITDPVPGKDIKQITVTVYWTAHSWNAGEPLSEKNKVVLTTLRAKD